MKLFDINLKPVLINSSWFWECGRGGGCWVVRSYTRIAFKDVIIVYPSSSQLKCPPLILVTHVTHEWTTLLFTRWFVRNISLSIYMSLFFTSRFKCFVYVSCPSVLKKKQNLIVVRNSKVLKLFFLNPYPYFDWLSLYATLYKYNKITC